MNLLKNMWFFAVFVSAALRGNGIAHTHHAREFARAAHSYTHLVGQSHRVRADYTAQCAMQSSDTQVSHYQSARVKARMRSMRGKIGNLEQVLVRYRSDTFAQARSRREQGGFEAYESYCVMNFFSR